LTAQQKNTYQAQAKSGCSSHISFACPMANVALIVSNQKRKRKTAGQDVGLAKELLFEYDKRKEIERKVK